ncbi:MAG: DUF368 domain-containing protein [Ruminococcaceae bacterium]|nr:DUF368 domain-containing protein [Oscillospiraceae bacterium]
MVKTESKKKAGNALLRFVQGVLLGSSGVLPGVSGGVLCVVFGIYKPLMEVLAAPVKKLKEHWKMLLPVGLGALAGLVLVVNLLGAVMENYKSLAECVFVGLILGTLPALIKNAGKEKRTAGSYVAFFASFILLFSLLAYLKYFSSFAVIPSFFWFVGAGAVFGISVVLPGLSAYTILEFFGLFKPIVNGALNFDFGVLVPIAIGGAAALILLSKAISSLYEKNFSIMSHIIIGVVVATTIPLIPTHFESFAAFALQLVLIACGFAVAITFEYFDKKIN